MKLVVQLLAFVGAAIGLWYIVFVPRKGKRSAILVPGWHYDEAVAETERLRAAYEDRLAANAAAESVRQAEWRRLRDEERARAIEADARLADTTAVLHELVAVVQDARVEVARLAGLGGAGVRDADR